MESKVIRVESLEIIPERESEIISIKHRGRVYEWEIWNLT